MAGIIGFPLGGWLGDREKRSGRGMSTPLNAVLIGSGLIVGSFVLLCFVRERRQPA